MWLVAIASAVVIVLAVGFVQAHRRLDIERGKNPLYAGVAGGAIGWIDYRGPLIHLRLYDGFMVIGGLRRNVLRYDEIDHVEMTPRDGIFLGSLWIVHHSSHVAKRIRIDVWDPERLKRLIDAQAAKASRASS